MVNAGNGGFGTYVTLKLTLGVPIYLGEKKLLYMRPQCLLLLCIELHISYLSVMLPPYM